MIAFFCGTPFQLMNAINLKISLHKDENAEIYVFNYFRNAEEIARNLEKINIFQKVYIIETNKYKSPYGIIKKFIMDNSIKKEFGNKNYKQLYICYNGLLQNLFYNLFLNTNKNMIVNFFDEGTATYIYPYKNALKSVYKIFLALLRMKSMDKHLDSVYLYCPSAIQENKQYKVKQLPKISKKNEGLINIYNQIFDYNCEENEFEGRKIIFFEESFSQDTDCSDEELIGMVLNSIDKDEIIVKRHPRVKKNRYIDYGVKYNKNSSIPWELYLLNNDFQEKILITLSSTAAISPKVIFDEEPRVIILYHLLDKKAYIHTDFFDKYIDSIKNLYKDKEKFLLTKTKEEFYRYINYTDKIHKGN